MDDNQKKVLRPLRRKFIAEAAIHSVLSGGLIVLPIWLIAAVIERAAGLERASFIWMPLVWAAISLLFCGIRYRPSGKQMAKRIDALDHRDSVGTMLEFADSPSIVCKLQREDALNRLKKLEPSALKIRVSVPALIACLILGMGIVLVEAAPENAFAWLPIERRAESEEHAMLREKVAQMREAVQASGLNDKQKEELLTQLDEMEAQIENGSMDMSMLTEISRRMDEMTTSVDQQAPLASYAQALLDQETLKDLGTAILDEDMKAVRSALHDIGDRLTSVEGNDQINAIMAVVYDIGATLRRPLQDEGQAKLTHAMVILSGDLENAAAANYEHRDNHKMIRRALESAGDRIEQFLGGDQAYEEEEEATAAEAGTQAAYRPHTFKDGENFKKQPPSETEYVYDPPESVRGIEYVPGEIGKDGARQRVLAPEDKTKDGTVPYGKVFGRYYAQYLDEQSEGSLPETLKEEIEAYFNGM